MISAADIQRIESKLDTILDALGLTNKRRMVPAERKELVNNIILQFEAKHGKNAKHDDQKST